MAYVFGFACDCCGEKVGFSSMKSMPMKHLRGTGELLGWKFGKDSVLCPKCAEIAKGVRAGVR